MKSPTLRIAPQALVAVASLLLCHTAAAAVGFTVSPAVVGNTYAGPITLQVTGLNAGATVVVQKYLDANNNGSIDATDTLWQQFNLTDGASFVIGGVTNINVPGDTDTVSGRITAKMNFQSDFTQSIIGNYLIKLSSPSGQFTAITKSFSVTNSPYAQKFTGNVVANGTNVPYASIILFQSAGGNDLNPIGGVVANNAGNYTLQAPPGTYAMAAFKTNFIADVSAAANVVLPGGATVTTNLSLIPAAETISGQFVDAGNSSIGLPGLLVSAQSTNNQLAIGFTGTNGNFAVAVTPGVWKFGADSGGTAFLGYVGLQNRPRLDTTGGGLSGEIFALPKATALFYGSVKDNFGTPLPGEVAVFSNDQNVTNNFNGSYESDGYTDTNGNFVVGIVGGSDPNELWNLQIDNASSFPNYDFSQPSLNQSGGTNVSAGEAVLANFTAIIATNLITGSVKYNGNPVVNAQVNANSEDSYNYSVQSYTDNSGNYTLTVANDNWNVYVDCQGGDNSLDGILGQGSYQCPCGTNVVVSNHNATANFAIFDAGGGAIFGYVTNIAGNPIVGVGISAMGCNGNNYSTSTGIGGYYSVNVPNGAWNISVDCGFLGLHGYQCVSNATVMVSSANVEQDFTAQSSGSTGGPLQIGTMNLPDDLAGNFYSQQLAASGGQSPYSWSLSPGSLALPAGLGLSPNGLLSGTPANSAVGTNYFSVRVTDNLGSTVDQLLSVAIYPPLVMATNNFPNGTLGMPYSAQLLVSGGDPFLLSGSPDGYVSSIYNGSLPPGLNFSYGAITSSNEYFVISGTPTNIGTFSFTLSAADVDGNQVHRDFSITIASSSFQMTTVSLRNATVGAFYSDQLQASGGALPYTWTIALGSQPPPPSLALSTNGLLSGVPAAIGTNSFIVRVTDFNLVTLTRTFTLTTTPLPGLGSESKSGSLFQLLINGAADQNYTLQVSTNLKSTNWISLFITNSAVNSFIATDPNATNSPRFYRVLVGP